MLEIGSIIDGKYKILNKIGQGGMSVVYLAMNERANKQWAIKEVRKDGVKDYDVVRQGLIAETDILKRLNHPHLPSIIDVIDRDDTFLIVMDYIEGKSLDHWLKKDGAQPQEKVVEWAKQICDVLGYLHSRKPPIIYRDLKPANVMLKPDGQIMIIDFGTAREFKETSIEDTSCLGTQGYAAPEQYGGHGQTDARTDIYTLGATMYHLLTGHNPSLPPYEMYPIRRWNPALSSGLEKIVLKCTQRNPNDRYQNCAELMYALEHYGELDSAYRRKQSIKWKSFVASCALTVVSLAGSIGFKVAESKTIKNSYDGYISEATKVTTQEERADYYEKAIKIDPEREEGYLELLDLFVYGADKNERDFNRDETAEMTAILGYKGTGNRTNENYFERNKEGYDEFAFRMGVYYFYYYEGGGSAGKSMAQPWFEKAQKGTTLDADKLQLAERFAKISGYYASLDSSDETGYGSSASYGDYWTDLTNLTDGDISKVVNTKTAVAIYEELIARINENAVDFKRAGVTKDQMMDKLSNTKTRLEMLQNEISQSDETWDGVLDSISAAEHQVNVAFSGRDTQPEQNQEEGGNTNGKQ
ncbi:MAG: serine/threonine protein kinase [Blautia stercoris]